jgi:hypothetical protein
MPSPPSIGVLSRNVVEDLRGAVPALRISLRTVCVGILTIIAPFAGTAAQELTPNPATWRPVSYADLRQPSGADRTYADIWKDALDENNRAYVVHGDTRFRSGNAPATEAHFVIWSTKRSVVLSILDTATGCTSKAAYPIAHATVKLCPLRVAVYEGVHVRTMGGGRACFLELQVGGARDPANSSVYVAYDVATRTIRTGVIVDHRAVDGCSQSIPVDSEPTRP